jgi:hypothetical protein
MSNNLRRYRAIRDALTQEYPGEPQGQRARHLVTLAALISGIVGSKRTQLTHIATHVPDGKKPESRGKRFARWVGRVPLNRSIRDSYTRHLRHADITRLCGLSSVLMLCGLI